MAKRKAVARTRKAARKTSRKPARKVSKPARKGAAGKTRAQVARRSRKSAAPRKAAARKAAAPKPAPKSQKRSTPIRPKPAALSRERRQLREEEMVPTPPSTLGYEPKASGAESGQNMYHQRMREHTEGGPILTGGDVDADWNEAYSSGEETPGGDMPTPDQDVVEEIGRALGVEYEDAEELKGAEKIENRDRHRWEYDPASAEDYRDRNRRDED